MSQTKREGSASGNNVRLDSALLNKIYNRYSQTKSNLKEILMHTFRMFVERLSKYKTDFEVLIKYITKYDFLLTRAHVAKIYNYTCPIIQDSDQSFIDAKDIRHPLIEQIQEGELYVPNDVSLGQDHTGVLLFGTNAVGKSSLIRSIGMSTILAQSGFFVPCSSFVYKPYKEIFTRILGNDDIFKGLSTFAVEMSELRVILKMADEKQKRPDLGAAFPKTYLKEYKYWAPVARVDNVYGDRNLVCSCPSMDEYKDAAA